MTAPALRDRALLLVATVASFWVLLQPSEWLRNAVRRAFGNPPYRGPWMTFEHLFLYSTLCAATCAIVWTAFARRGLMPPPREWLRVDRPARIVVWGVGTGVAIAGFNLAVLAGLPNQFPGFAIGYVPPNGWDILGNVFSNFYEEFISRGFLLLALRAIFRNTPIAVVIVSALFGWGHDQYPLVERVVIALASALQCIVCLRTRSLWSQWITHEVYDLILDCTIRVGG